MEGLPASGIRAVPLTKPHDAGRRRQRQSSSDVMPLRTAYLVSSATL